MGGEIPETNEPGTKYEELEARLNKNLSDYYNSLQGFGQSELIDMAGKISAMQDTHSFLTSSCPFSEDELDFYLQFQSPLEVIADAWAERAADTSDMSFVLYELYDKQGALVDYPLMDGGETPGDMSLRRYMDVDLELYLGKIAEKVIIHYPNDWKYDAEELNKIADSSDSERKRLLWHVCSYGTHLKNERDVFVRDSGAFGYMTDYHQNDPDMFGYAIEVTGRGGGIVRGNIFEVGDYAEYAKHIREASLPLDSVTLTYSDFWGVNAGKTITVSRKEYDDDRHRLMSKSGNVVKVRFNPLSEAELADVLRREHSTRMALPLGSTGELLRKMAGKLSAARNTHPISEQNTDKKTNSQTPPEKPKTKTLEEKFNAAKAKANAQESRGANAKNKKRDERG